MLAFFLLSYYNSSIINLEENIELKPIIELRNLVKNYGDLQVVKDIDLTIYENEFVTLLGPSGCGKTTTLRMIGGFEKPDSGDIIIDGKIINDLPAFARPVNTVFQRYALFPHLNVFKNVAFGIQNISFKQKADFYGGLEKLTAEARSLNENRDKKITRRDITKLIKKHIDESVMKALDMVNLIGFENRRVDQMSGGQMQRVALARALVLRPKILLLDEPLSALDLKLRHAMHYELKEMQRNLGITFIFVTHDQEEAMTMSDRVVVMKDGIVQQLGTPKEIYNEPVNRFVANFIGESNIITGTWIKQNVVNFLDVNFDCVGYQFADNELVDVVIRPEDFDVVPLKKAKLVGTVLSSIFKGVYYELRVDIKGIEFVIHTYEDVKIDDQIGLSVDPYEICLMKVDGSCKTIISV